MLGRRVVGLVDLDLVLVVVRRGDHVEARVGDPLRETPPEAGKEVDCDEGVVLEAALLQGGPPLRLGHHSAPS